MRYSGWPACRAIGAPEVTALLDDWEASALHVVHRPLEEWRATGKPAEPVDERWREPQYALATAAIRSLNFT